MYVARRHSRRLFFPAGLLALAWLLRLGCALLAQRPELRRFRQRVIQVSLPPLKQPLVEVGGQRISLSLDEMYASPARLAAMHPWHTVHFTGNAWQDHWAFQTAAFVAQQLTADPDHDRGLRVQFGPRSQYRSLVAMLDIFQAAGLKRYWLDVRHEPISLNTFTERPKPQPSSKPESLPVPSAFICSGVITEPELLPAPLHVELATLLDTASWQPLLASRWRYSALLLLPLAAAWQLRRLQTVNSRR